MNTLVIARDELRRIVNTTNSFTKEQIVANREVIKELRAEKKERLSSFTGTHVAAIVETAKTKGFVVADVKEMHGNRTDKMMIVLKRKNTESELDRALKALEKAQAAYEKARAVAA
jgi:formate dehydrogenase assembly factor FdhD